MHKKNKFINIISRITLVIFGAILIAVSLEIFLIPNRLVDGGIVGISIIFSHLTGAKLGIITFVLNIPFFIIGYKQIGKTFALTTLFANLIMSIFVTILHPVSSLTNDVLLASVFGGLIMGTGVGIVIRNGGSLDGTEIVGIILDKRTAFSIGEIVMFFNFFILSSAGFVFGWDRAMYSLITYFIAYKTIDIVVEGLDESKAVFIVSDQHKEIYEAIRDRLGRSITIIQGKGDGTDPKSRTNIIYVIVTRLEVSKLKSIVYGFDVNALMTIGSVEVHGRKFKKKAIH